MRAIRRLPEPSACCGPSEGYSSYCACACTMKWWYGQEIDFYAEARRRPPAEGTNWRRTRYQIGRTPVATARRPPKGPRYVGKCMRDFCWGFGFLPNRMRLCCPSVAAAAGHQTATRAWRLLRAIRRLPELLRVCMQHKVVTDCEAKF